MSSWFASKVGCSVSPCYARSIAIVHRCPCGELLSRIECHIVRQCTVLVYSWWVGLVGICTRVRSFAANFLLDAEAESVEIYPVALVASRSVCGVERKAVESVLRNSKVVRIVVLRTRRRHIDVAQLCERSGVSRSRRVLYRECCGSAIHCARACLHGVRLACLQTE